MGLRRTSPEPESDASPGTLTAAVTPEEPDEELGRFRHPPYSMWGGMKYILVLSILLWWLPTIGQMIAGYIGGRRAGGPWRAVIASLVPVAVIGVLAWGADRGTFNPWMGALAGVPGAVGQGVSAALPPLEPYVHFVLGYLAAFVDALKSTLAMGQNGYLVTIVFAYIGGILAEQARYEAGSRRGTTVGISISPHLLAGFRHPQATSWEDRSGGRFEDLQKIPVHAARGAKPHKVETRPAVPGAKEGTQPAGDVHPKPERPEPTPHDKEVATKRFVERALRQYDAAHRR